MQRRLTWALALTPLTLVAPAALGQVYDPNVAVSTSLTTVAQSGSVNVLDLGTGSGAGLVSQAPVSFGSGANAGTITYAGTSGIYMGNVAGVTAAPWTPTGREAGNYFAVQPSGGISISFAQQQQYFGIMWGSVDTYNTLSFYRGDTLVEQLPGKAVTNNPNGSQAALGTYFVNLNFGGGTSFDRVVATSSNPAFEFNVIAYSTTTQAITPAQQVAQGGTSAPTSVSVPVNAAPAAATPLLAALVGFWRRRRRVRAA